MRHIGLVGALAVTLLGAGCRGRAEPTTGTAVTERHTRNLLTQGARALRCDVGAVTNVQIAADVYSVAGCGAAVEYRYVCGGRHCRWEAIRSVPEVAATDLGGQCQAFVVTGIPSLQRTATGCGVSLGYTLGCNQVGCAWQRTSGDTAAVPATYQATTAPAPSGDLVATVQQVLAQRLTTAQQCLEGQHTSMHVQFDAGRLVAVELDAPFHGTTVEQCVRQAVGEIEIALDGVSATGIVSVQL